MANTSLTISHIPNLLPSQIVSDLWMLVNTLERHNGKGINREKNKTCLTDAKNDYEAFETWLKKYENKSPLTYNQYKREIERLFLWGISERKKVLSDFSIEDFQNYMSFLDNPYPTDKWVMKPSNRTPYGSLKWRPFTGALNANAKAKTMTIIRTMLEFWVTIGYLSLNPMKALSGSYEKPDENTENLNKHARILEMEEWEALLQTLKDLPDKTSSEKQEKLRLNLVIKMLFYLGVRISTLVTHSWGSFQKTTLKMDGELKTQWWFYATVKGNKRGKIPVHEHLMDDVREFRSYFKLPTEPLPLEETPLIPSWRQGKSLGARQINRLLKELLLMTYESHFKERPELKGKFEQFSAHWLRHMAVTRQFIAGIPMPYIQANMIHSHAKTTQGYNHLVDEERYNSLQKLDMK